MQLLDNQRRLFFFQHYHYHYHLFICFRSCPMFSTNMHVGQRCVRLLRGRIMSIITHPSTDCTAAPQQPLGGHTTSVKHMHSILAQHPVLHSGHISSQTTEGRLGVGGLRYCSVTQHRCQVKQSDCEEPEAKNVMIYEQAQAPSRPDALEKCPSLSANGPCLEHSLGWVPVLSL